MVCAQERRPVQLARSVMAGEQLVWALARLEVDAVLVRARLAWLPGRLTQV